MKIIKLKLPTHIFIGKYIKKDNKLVIDNCDIYPKIIEYFNESCYRCSNLLTLKIFNYAISFGRFFEYKSYKDIEDEY